MLGVPRWRRGTLLFASQGFATKLKAMDAYTHDGWLAVEHNSILTKLSTPQKFELLVKMKEARRAAGTGPAERGRPRRAVRDAMPHAVHSCGAASQLGRRSG
jgi:hypothetical protein